MKKVDIHSKVRILDDYFHIDAVHFQHELLNGEMSEPKRKLIAERGDSVAALVVNIETQKVILVKQFRMATYEKGPGWVIEVVAGKLESGETPLEAIHREILEEVGYDICDDIYEITTFYVSPGGYSERVILYYVFVKNANRVSDGGGLALENEDIEVVEMSIDEFLNYDFCDAKTIIAQLRLMWRRNNNARSSISRENEGL